MYTIIIPLQVFVEQLFHCSWNGIDCRDRHLAIVILRVHAGRLALEHTYTITEMRALIKSDRRGIDGTNTIDQVKQNKYREDRVLFLQLYTLYHKLNDFSRIV